MLDGAGVQLRDELERLFSRPIDEPLDDRVFDAHARAVHAYQYERNHAYRAFCDRRNADPSAIEHWTAIPALPAGAFKAATLIAGDVRSAEAVFRTSGTTGGGDRRGTHYIPDLSLYHASLLPNFAARVLPGLDPGSVRMLSLMPHADEMPDSSLAHMITVVIDRLGARDSTYCATAADGINVAAIEQHLRQAERKGRPVCILGTSFAYVHWLDDLRARGESFALPPGSRLMDTGGYKGRSREVPVDIMLQSYDTLLGLPPHMCINEYGMTELCSQMYDSSLTHPGELRIKRPPPWLRVRIVDPVSLQPVDEGETGLVQLFDLANLGSVLAIQTEDLGVEIDGGFRISGRAPGATPRGCSIAMDDLLSALNSRGA